MYCANCGGLVEETASYCPYCGNIFNVAEPGRRTRLPTWMLVLAGVAAFTSVTFALLPYFRGAPEPAPVFETPTPVLLSERPVVIPTVVQSRPSPKPTSTPAPTLAPPPPPTRQPEPAVKEPDQSFNKTLRGTINDRFPIQMTLQRRGTTLTGTYYYLKQGINITLEGTIDQGGNVNLNGLDRDGTWIDMFQGRFISDSELVGTWSKPNGERSAPFRVLEIH